MRFTSVRTRRINNKHKDMNLFNIIIIVGYSGTGKSLLANHYIASHPKAYLVDSLKLYEASPTVISAFQSIRNIDEMANCDTLIIDEIPSSPCLETLSNVLSHRIRHKRNTVILSQSTHNVERIFDLGKWNRLRGTLLTLTKDTDVDAFCLYLDIMLKVRSDRPLELNLWKWGNSIKSIVDEQEQHISLSSEDWNVLLNKPLFWQLLGKSNLQSLVMNEAGEDMENGAVDWSVANEYLGTFTQDKDISQRLKESFIKILSWVDEPSENDYLLGLNFIKANAAD